MSTKANKLKKTRTVKATTYAVREAYRHDSEAIQMISPDLDTQDIAALYDAPFKPYVLPHSSENQKEPHIIAYAVVDRGPDDNDPYIHKIGFDIMHKQAAHKMIQGLIEVFAENDNQLTATKMTSTRIKESDEPKPTRVYSLNMSMEACDADETVCEILEKNGFRNVSEHRDSRLYTYRFVG